MHAPAAAQWTDLMTQLSATYPDAVLRVIVDVLNEPDFGNLRWEAQLNAPGMKELYLDAWDAIYPVAPSRVSFSSPLHAMHAGHTDAPKQHLLTTSLPVTSTTGQAHPLSGRPQLD